MKKVKIMLTALIVVAAVGGALAFKATKTIYELDPETGRCTVPIPYTITTTGDNIKTVTTVFDGLDCTTKKVKVDL